jgi:hypothetical protein
MSESEHEKPLTRGTTASPNPLDQLCIDTVRFLSVDAVQQANSGHPGLPLGAAPMAYVLWARVLRHNPADPGWFDRDRFVLSAGHGSMLRCIANAGGMTIAEAQLAARYNGPGFAVIDRCGRRPQRGELRVLRAGECAAAGIRVHGRGGLSARAGVDSGDQRACRDRRVSVILVRPQGSCES